jgi:hypothetical protein
MSELLQSDLTEDTAATALLSYLSKLEEVARLEPCGIHYVENNPGTADDVVHVVARTAGGHRKYYYRRREYGYWTPWEQIKLDIEDNPVIPVVWKDRLLLFWLRILKQTPIDPASLPTSPDSPATLDGTKLSDLKNDARTDAVTRASVRMQAILCWSEYYNGKWQPTKTSDVNRPTDLGQFAPAGQGAFDRSQLLLGASEEQEALRVSIFGAGSSSFLLYNTHSSPAAEEDAPLAILKDFKPVVARYLGTSTDTFSINYRRGGIDPLFRDAGWGTSFLRRDVLTNPIADGSVEPRHHLQNIWDAPFFYVDRRHVFYVTTTEALVKIPDHSPYGILAPLPKPQVFEIPPLVLPSDPLLNAVPDPYSPVIKGPDPGVVDPYPVERFVTEDANIRTGIGTIATVRYGEQEIGPKGVLSVAQLRQG